MEKIQDFLDSNGYLYSISNGKINVNLLKFLDVEISNMNNRLHVDARTTKWTGFSGFVALKFENVVKLNTIGLFIMLVIGEMSKLYIFEKYDYTYIFLIAIALNFFWYFHTLIVYENFKSKIEVIYFNSKTSL